jgi:nicotinamide-nucleotide amidase
VSLPSKKPRKAARPFILTTVESCTGGALASAITDVPGSSAIFQEGFVLYSDQSKIRFGIPAADLRRGRGPYSTEVLQKLARLACRKTGANVAIVVTGVLTRADPAHPKVPVGSVRVGIRVREKYREFRFQVHDRDRGRAKRKIVATALKMLLGLLRQAKK